MEEDYDPLLDELLSHPDFNRWAIGQAPELDELWKAWAGTDPVKHSVLIRARSVASAFHLPSLPDIHDHDISAKVKQAIAMASAGESRSARQRITKLRQAVAVAASVLLLIGLGWWNLRPELVGSTEENSSASNAVIVPDALITYRNETSERRHIQLSDGSSVVLQPGSELRYPSTFGAETREVALTGEAFFEVVKNKTAPFFILANQTVTRVVGTSFRLKAKPGSQLLEVNVKSGTVAIYKKTKGAGLEMAKMEGREVTLLEKDERAVFEIKDKELIQQADRREMPARLAIEKISFRYEAVPLSTVLADLEKAYGVTIRYGTHPLAGCSVTAELGDEPLATKLKWLSVILEAEYTIENNEIIINGKPCQ